MKNGILLIIKMQYSKNLIQVVSKTFLMAILVCLCFTHNYAQHKIGYLSNTPPVSKPEAGGFSSAGTLKFKTPKELNDDC